jgi:hypothetical protein
MSSMLLSQFSVTVLLIRLPDKFTLKLLEMTFLLTDVIFSMTTLYVLHWILTYALFFFLGLLRLAWTNLLAKLRLVRRATIPTLMTSIRLSSKMHGITVPSL